MTLLILLLFTTFFVLSDYYMVVAFKPTKSIEPTHPTQHELNVEILPTCGSAERGFKIVINANGFKPNATLVVKFLGSDGKVPLYIALDTNSTGRFNDVTFANDLKADQL